MSSKQVILLPSMGRSHLMPFLQLAHQIKTRSRGLTITILTTSQNVQFLAQISNKFGCPDHGLPENAEDTNVLPLTDMIKLLRASTALEAPLRRFIEEEIVGKDEFPPLCIISDLFLGWGVQVAKSFRSLALTFSTAGAYGTAAYTSIWRDLPHQSCSEEKEFKLAEFPKTHRFHLSHLSPIARTANGMDEWSMFFRQQMNMSMESAGWLCNTVEELEPLGLSVLRNYTKLPVWAIGSTISGVKMHESDQTVITWLDLQAEESVVYISFGSQNTITRSQMMELAIGLEESGKPFVWVIRPPFGFDVAGGFDENWLPIGFVERVVDTEKRGFLVHEFAPQRKILSHKSTGAFLSHCGWNSVLEALSEGVPMIGWPLAAEQAFNSKMMEEELEVAMEVARGLDGKVNREDVKRAVNMALDRHGKGGNLKRNAVEIVNKLRQATQEECGLKGSVLYAIDDFLRMVLQQTRSSIEICN